jgi:hypothetical protein
VIDMDELKKYGSNIWINNYELSVLEKCDIDVKGCNTIDEVLLLIDKYLDDAIDLNDEEYDEIDYVAGNLSERKYYWGTNK